MNRNILLLPILFCFNCGLFDNFNDKIVIRSVEIMTVDNNEFKRSYDIYPALTNINDSNPTVSFWSLNQFHYSDTCCWLFDSSNAELPDTTNKYVFNLSIYLNNSGLLMNDRIGWINFNPDIIKSNEIITSTDGNIKAKINFKVL